VDEYWIIDVNGQQFEVYDRPEAGRFTRVRTFGAGETIAPAAFEDLVIGVDELFT
jgi:Uma2 family endonuclease